VGSGKKRCPSELETYPNMMSQQSNRVAAKPKYKQNKQPDLSADQKQEIREAFDLFDTDGSGTHQFI
jgi:hypothetical protein